MVYIRAYVVDLKYIYEERNVCVILFCRDENGKIICIKDYYRPNFYVLPRKDTNLISLMAKINRIRIDDEHYVTSTSEESKTINCSEEKFVKVFVNRPETVHAVKNIIIKWQDIINCFEDDISLTRKYLMENRLIPFSMFEAEVVDNDFSEYGYKAYKLVKFIQRDIIFSKPILLSLCVHYEYDPLGNKAISSIAISSENLNLLITWKESHSKIKDSLLSIKKVISEYDLIVEFRNIIEDFNPDVLLFENESFGLDDLLLRAKKYKIWFPICFDKSEPFVNKITGKTRTVGINEIFMNKLIDNFISLSLLEENIREAYANINNIVNLATVSFVDEDEQIAMLLTKKARLNYSIFDSFFINITEMLNLLGFRLADLLNLSPKKLIEWILIKESIYHNHIVINKNRNITERDERPSQINNYHFIDTVPGIYSNIAEINLSFLYPTLIVKENLSPETLHCQCCDGFCKKRKGILPEIVERILNKIERLNQALKLTDNQILSKRRAILMKIMNYFYTYLCSSNSRWYSTELIETLNSKAKLEINLLLVKTKNLCNVVYSDYRFLYVELKVPFEEFSDFIKKQYPEFSWFKVRAIYPKAIFLPRKEAKKPGKRVAFLDEKDKNIIISRNIILNTNPQFLNKTLEKLMHLILNETQTEQIIKFIKEKIDLIIKHKLNIEDVVLKIKLKKDINYYYENTIHHTLIKRMIEKKREIKKGDIIEYVIIESEDPFYKRAKLLEDLQQENKNGITFNYDAEYYLTKVFIPGIEDFLVLKGINVSEIVNVEHQKGLDGYI